MPYLQVLSEFREGVRRIAREHRGEVRLRGCCAWRSSASGASAGRALEGSCPCPQRPVVTAQHLLGRLRRLHPAYPLCSPESLRMRGSERVLSGSSEQLSDGQLMASEGWSTSHSGGLDSRRPAEFT